MVLLERELGCKTSAWSAGPADNAWSFPGDLNMQASTQPGAVGWGQGQAAHLGLGCPNQIFMISDQNSSDAIRSSGAPRRDSGGSGGRETVSICKIKLWGPSLRSPLKPEEAHFHACPRGDKKKFFVPFVSGMNLMHPPRVFSLGL